MECGQRSSAIYNPTQTGNRCPCSIPRVSLFQVNFAGLLAGLWEFPCIAVKPDCPVQKTWPPLQQYLSLQVGKHTFCGTVYTVFQFHNSAKMSHHIRIPPQVPHQFSHTLHHYHVWHIVTPSPPPLPTVPPHKWVTGTQLLQSAISTAVRKAS